MIVALNDQNNWSIQGLCALDISISVHCDLAAVRCHRGQSNLVIEAVRIRYSPPLIALMRSSRLSIKPNYCCKPDHDELIELDLCKQRPITAEFGRQVENASSKPRRRWKEQID